MTQCDKYFEWISAYVDGELDDAAQAELMEYLATCPACSAALTEQLILSSELQTLDAAPPETLVADVMAQIQTQADLTVHRPVRRFPMRRFVAVAAVFAVVAVLGLQTLRNMPAGGELGGSSLQAPAPEAAPAEVRMADDLADEDLTSEWARAEPTAEEAEYFAEPEEFESFYAIDADDADLFGESDRGIYVLSFDTTFFDKYVTGSYWSWEGLSEALLEAGHVYVLDEGTFTVQDPYNPGSYLYGSLGMDPDFSDESVVIIGYRFRQGDILRQVEVWFMHGEAMYYYDVLTHYGGGSVAWNMLRLRQFILSGQ